MKQARRTKTTSKQPSSDTELGMSLEELHELEEKAVRLEKLAKMLLNTPQQAFYLYDHRAGQFLLGQERLSGLFGYKAGEIEKRPNRWMGIVHPDDVEEFAAAHARVLEGRGGEVQNLRMRVRCKKGDFEWILARMRPFERDAEGHVISEVGMVNIITPLVEAESALRETQARCHNLFQRNTAGVLVFDSAFQIVDANPAACRLLGYEKSSLLRLGVLDVTAPGARVEMHKLLRVLKSGSKAPANVDITFEHKKGGKVEVMAGPTSLHGEKGGFHQGMLILTNITDRKAIEAALKREAELNQILVDHAPVAIGLLAADGSVVRVNPAAEKLFGFQSKDLKGKVLWKLPVVGPDQTASSKQRFDALTQGDEGKISGIVPLRTRSGETRLVETESTAVKKPDGSVDFLVTTGTDVTERHRLEVEVIRVAEQEHIRIGHDLHDGVGQTLTGIASLVEALETRLQGEDQKDIRRIHELVKEAITETRRLSHGLSPAAVKNRGLAGGLMLIAETVRENFRRECICHLEEPVPAVRQEVEIHLFRIAQEAVNNAIRHGGATKIRISLRHKSASLGVLEVRDNGPGFPTGKNQPKSDGIGLRVMEHRANLINSELSVQTLKGKGVRVVCRFPLTDP